MPKDKSKTAKATTEENESDDKEESTHCRKFLVKDAHGAVKELVFPKALDLDRPKRERTTFSSRQLNGLEEVFKHNQYLIGKDRTAVAKRLGLTETQVKVWFQNRRTKHKKDNERSEDNKDATAESKAAQNVLKLLEYSFNNALGQIPGELHGPSLSKSDNPHSGQCNVSDKDGRAQNMLNASIKAENKQRSKICQGIFQSPHLQEIFMTDGQVSGDFSVHGDLWRTPSTEDGQRNNPVNIPSLSSAEYRVPGVVPSYLSHKKRTHPETSHNSLSPYRDEYLTLGGRITHPDRAIDHVIHRNKCFKERDDRQQLQITGFLSSCEADETSNVIEGEVTPRVSCSPKFDPFTMDSTKAQTYSSYGGQASFNSRTQSLPDTLYKQEVTGLASYSHFKPPGMAANSQDHVPAVPLFKDQQHGGSLFNLSSSFHSHPHNMYSFGVQAQGTQNELYQTAQSQLRLLHCQAEHSSSSDGLCQGYKINDSLIGNAPSVRYPTERLVINRHSRIPLTIPCWVTSQPRTLTPIASLPLHLNSSGAIPEDLVNNPWATSPSSYNFNMNLDSTETVV